MIYVRSLAECAAIVVSGLAEATTDAWAWLRAHQD